MRSSALIEALGRRLHYAWVVMAVTFVAMLVAGGIRSVPGVLILPLEGEFGWDRATVSLAVSINLLLYGLCGPFAASVMERLGMQRTMGAALLIIAVSVGLTTQMRTAWQLHVLWGLMVGIGAGSIAGWVAATVSNRWFVKRRGLAVGLLTAAGSAGQLLFLPMLAQVVQMVGWRTAVALASGAAFLVFPLVLIFLRDHPRDLGLEPYGASASAAAVIPSRPALTNPFAAAMATLGKSVRHRDFLLLAGSFFVCGASANGLIATHLIPASVEHGMPEVTAAGFLAILGIFNVIGTTISGWLSDRFDNRRLLAWYYGLRGLSLMFLPAAYEAGLPALAIFVVFYGLDWVATVPPTVRLAADRFGKAQVGIVFSWIFVAHQIGAGSIALGAGLLRTWLGDYHASFILAGVLCLVAVAMVLRMERGVPVERPATPSTARSAP